MANSHFTSTGTSTGTSPGPNGCPHLTQTQIQQRLDELETATGQRRIDLMTELAWRPAWAIRSRRGVLSLLKQWWKVNQHRRRSSRQIKPGRHSTD